MAILPSLATSESHNQDKITHPFGSGSKLENDPSTRFVPAEAFARSLDICRQGARRDRWKRSIAALESDPLFAESEFGALADAREEEWRELAVSLFEKLSSGHSIVLLTITRLVELVDERTLVLLDEPECHLHPPLLAAFIRALSDLLTERNGVAVVATHSPVVLQEAPRTCIWKITRAGVISEAERPIIETFGENVGVLTREVFGLEVTASGYHRMIAEAARASGGDYAIVLENFSGQLGSEARSIARGLAAEAAE